jgi:hypothetical protein
MRLSITEELSDRSPELFVMREILLSNDIPLMVIVCLNNKNMFPFYHQFL